jgi:hypothetical protein
MSLATCPRRFNCNNGFEKINLPEIIYNSFKINLTVEKFRKGNVIFVTILSNFNPL